MEKGTECIWAWVSACNRSLCLGFFTLCCGPCSPAGQIIGLYLATYLEKRDRLLESLLWIILQTELLAVCESHFSNSNSVTITPFFLLLF